MDCSSQNNRNEKGFTSVPSGRQNYGKARPSQIAGAAGIQQERQNLCDYFPPIAAANSPCLVDAQAILWHSARICRASLSNLRSEDSIRN